MTLLCPIVGSALHRFLVVREIAVFSIALLVHWELICLMHAVERKIHYASHATLGLQNRTTLYGWVLYRSQPLKKASGTAKNSHNWSWKEDKITTSGQRKKGIRIANQNNPCDPSRPETAQASAGGNFLLSGTHSLRKIGKDLSWC